MRQQTQPRGLSRSELIIALVSLVIIFVVLSVTLLSPHGHNRRHALALKDRVQTQQITKALLISPMESNGVFPAPSLVVPKKEDGTEDYSLNHSANFYSMLIMKRYFNTDLLVSPLEPSDAVLSKDDYDFNKYDPLNGPYWDDSFVMHIEDDEIGANSSYAHVALIGDRRDALHTSKISDNMPILGTRTYDFMNLDPSDYNRSITFELLPPYDKWTGNIAFADGHAESTDSFYFPDTTFETTNGIKPDNIFAAEFDHPNGKQAAADAFLCISTAASQYTVNDVYDPLLDE